MFSVQSISTGFTFPSLRIPAARSKGRARISAQAIGGAVSVSGRGLYGVLGVEERASAGEIKAAYRSLAKRFHPDVDPNSNGSEFLEICRAYSTLSDPIARETYDRTVMMTIGWAGLGSGKTMSRRWETDQCW